MESIILYDIYIEINIQKQFFRLVYRKHFPCYIFFTTYNP